MLRTTTLLVPGFALALSACTITTYSNAPPPPPAAPAAATPAAGQPAQPAARAPATATRRPATPARAPAAPTRTAPPSSSLAPRITETIVFGNGRGGAFRGLAYVIPNDTKKLPDLGSMVPFATFFTDSLDIKSQPFTSGFPGALQQNEWFAIRYEGTFEIPTDGGWQIKLESDDGAVLSIDGVKVIDNDGEHTVSAKTAMRALKAGPHRLRVDYFQATGPVALSLYLVDKNADVVIVGKR